MKMVEACIVLPIIILISLGMIYYTIFQYENLNLQVRCHQELLEKEPHSLPIKKFETQRYNSIRLGRVIEDVTEKKIYARKYVINIPRAVKIQDAT